MENVKIYRSVYPTDKVKRKSLAPHLNADLDPESFLLRC